MPTKPGGSRKKRKGGSEGLPPGFKPLRVTSVVAHQMQESAEHIRAWLESEWKMDADVKHRTNRDGSIDVMVRVSRLPRVFPRDTQTRFLIGLKDVLTANRMPYVRVRGVWYFSGAGVDAKNYDWKTKGRVAASTYAHDFGSAAAIEKWRMSMSDVLKHLKRKRNPQSLTIALYSHLSLI